MALGGVGVIEVLDSGGILDTVHVGMMMKMLVGFGVHVTDDDRGVTVVGNPGTMVMMTTTRDLGTATPDSLVGDVQLAGILQ